MKKDFKEIKANIKDIAKKGKVFSLRLLIDQLKKIFDFIDDVDIDTIKICWNYQEKCCETYTLEESINWIKSSLKNPTFGGCIYKEKINDVYHLHLCLLDLENNEPMLDGNHPHLEVKCMQIDDELKSQFKDKDLIVIK